jgi:hypothetical protein
MKRQHFLLVLAAVLVGYVFTNFQTSKAGSTLRLETLAGKTHIHGIAVDSADPTRLYLATHHGFYVLSSDGNATRLSENSNDYMGFTPHPTDPRVFFASGHPSQGGNTGFIQSVDGGRTWQQLSAGVGGPVDFHQMDVSRVDSNLIYGVFRGLQVSEDGGNTWHMAAKTPPKLFDLAASANDTETLFAATQNGLFITRNRGQSWKPAHFNRAPASMVQTASDGSVYTFVAGLGLLHSPDDSMQWTRLSNNFDDRYLLHLAVDPTNPAKLYAVTNTKEVLASRDGGVTWKAL